MNLKLIIVKVIPFLEAKQCPHCNEYLVYEKEEGELYYCGDCEYTFRA